MQVSKLKEYVNNRLSQLTTIPIFDSVADDDSTFPYLVFKFTSGTPNNENGRILWIVELDYWNNSNDDRLILSEAEKVKEGFNNYWENQTDGFYTSKLDFESEIPDTNINMSRYNQRYLLKVR